jgi:hypothetical protein
MLAPNTSGSIVEPNEQPRPSRCGRTSGALTIRHGPVGEALVATPIAGSLSQPGWPLIRSTVSVTA